MLTYNEAIAFEKRLSVAMQNAGFDSSMIWDDHFELCRVRAQKAGLAMIFLVSGAEVKYIRDQGILIRRTVEMITEKIRRYERGDP